MKFFHLSDLHIGKQLHGYRLLEDQEYILDQIVRHTDKFTPDAVFIAGDIYDKPVPPAEAVRLFDRFLTELSRKVPHICIVAGNHDSGMRLDYASRLLEAHHVHIAGEAPSSKEERIKKIVMRDDFGEVNIWLLPFVKPGYVRHFLNGADTYEQAVRLLLERENIDPAQRNILVAHQFFIGGSKEPLTSDSEMVHVGGLEQVSYETVERFDYVALGHLHRPQTVGADHIVYCGSPLKYSVSEAEDTKYLYVVEIGEKQKKGSQLHIQREPLYPLHDVRKIEGTLEELLAGDPTGVSGKDKRCFSDYVSLLLKDGKELYRPRRRLETVYERILEIRLDRRQMEHMLKEMEVSSGEEEMSPEALFARFFREMNGRDMNESEKTVMRDVFANIPVSDTSEREGL